MANEFHRAVIFSHIDEETHLVIPPDDLSGFVMPPERAPDGKFNMVLMQPTGEERHAALGKFMDAWSKLEMMISELLMLLMEVGREPMPAIINSVGAQGQREVIMALAVERLSEPASMELAKLMERVKTNTTRRNYIVHGYWMLEFHLLNHGGKPAVRTKQLRAYSPTSLDQRRKINTREGRDVASIYRFSLPRITSLTREVGRIREDIAEFIRENIRGFHPRFAEADQFANRWWFLPSGHLQAKVAPRGAPEDYPASQKWKRREPEFLYRAGNNPESWKI